MKKTRVVKGIMVLFCALMVGCGSSGSKNNSSSSSSVSSNSQSSAESQSSSSSSAATGWELVWSDEFDGDAIDTSKWSHEVNCAGGGNNELQCYTARSENSYVADGKLHIVARRETYSGPPVFDDDPAYNPNDISKTQAYTSARLRTKNKGDWTYGRLEIRARMPHGQGIWPAIWMLPTDWRYGPWPLSGEIDIFEAVNSGTVQNGVVNNDVHGTLHYGRPWPGNLYTGGKTVPAENIWEAFHTYAIEWEEGEIRWYVDDTHFLTQTSDGWFTYFWDDEAQGFSHGGPGAPFDQQFHVIMNVAVGGNWPGSPDGETSFPQRMEVDYVRVYRCNLDPETGKGCATHVNPDIQPLPGNPPPEQKTFSLYDGGPASFTFTVSGQALTNTLVPALYDGGVSGNVVSSPAYNLDGEIVWDLMFNAAPGNAFLSSGDMSAVEGVNDGLKLTNMAVQGELKFDLRVDAIAPGTQLHIKLDSGWPNVSHKAITLPPVGEWVSVSVPFAQLLPNDIQPGQANLEQVINPFVIEPAGGTAHIKLRNIRILCLASCDLGPVLASVGSVLDDTVVIYADGDVGPNWDFGLGKWDNDTGHVSIGEVADPERGEVIRVAFSNSGDNGLAFIQSTSAKDGTAFAATGYLEFDIKVISYGSNSGGLVVKAESGPAQGTGDYVLSPSPALGVWQTYQIPLADMLALPGSANGPLNLAGFNTPFVFLPAWGDQAGVEVLLDNIRWILP